MCVPIALPHESLHVVPLAQSARLADDRRTGTQTSDRDSPAIAGTMASRVHENKEGNITSGCLPLRVMALPPDRARPRVLRDAQEPNLQAGHERPNILTLEEAVELCGQISERHSSQLGFDEIGPSFIKIGKASCILGGTRSQESRYRQSANRQHCRCPSWPFRSSQSLSVCGQ